MAVQKLLRPHILKKKSTPIFPFFSVLHLFHPRLQWLDSHFLALLSTTGWTDHVSSHPVKENGESFNLMKSYRRSSQRTHFWSLQNCYCWEAWSRHKHAKYQFLLSNLFGFLLPRWGQIFHPFQLLKLYIVHVNPLLPGLHRQIIIFLWGERNVSLTFQGSNEGNTISSLPNYLA